MKTLMLVLVVLSLSFNGCGTEFIKPTLVKIPKLAPVEKIHVEYEIRSVE